MVRKGVFIAVEGLPGAGKTTVCDALERRMGRAGVQDVVRTSEPGGTAPGDSIRRLLQKHDGDPKEAIAPLTRLLLLTAARAELVGRVIRPALTTGGVVLCDTFATTLNGNEGAALDGNGSPVLPEALIDALTDRAVSECVPDLAILLDGDPEALLERRRGKKTDADARALLAHSQRARDRFRHVAEREPGRFRILDASGGSAQDVTNGAWELVKGVLRGRGIAFGEDPEPPKQEGGKG